MEACELSKQKDQKGVNYVFYSVLADSVHKRGELLSFPRQPFPHPTFLSILHQDAEVVIRESR